MKINKERKRLDDAKVKISEIRNEKDNSFL